jgi:hypothetical protein
VVEVVLLELVEELELLEDELLLELEDEGLLEDELELLEEEELELLEEELELLEDELLLELEDEELLEVVEVSPVGLLLLLQPEKTRAAASASPVQAASGFSGGRCMERTPFAASGWAEARGATSPSNRQARNAERNGRGRSAKDPISSGAWPIEVASPREDVQRCARRPWWAASAWPPGWWRACTWPGGSIRRASLSRSTACSASLEPSAGWWETSSSCARAR